MSLTPQELEGVKAAIEAIRLATGAEEGLFHNEEVRDGSKKVLWFEDGRFYLVIHSGHGLGSFSQRTLGLSIYGYIQNDETKLAEALTLHVREMNEVTLNLALNDGLSFVDTIVNELVPNVRNHAAAFYDQQKRKQRQRANVQATQERFGMKTSSEKLLVPGYGVHAEVYPSHAQGSDAAEMNLTLSGLHPDEVSHILATLGMRRHREEAIPA